MNNLKDLRVGVVGVGTMGRHHVRLASQTPGVTLVGLHDVDESRGRQMASDFGCIAFSTLEELISHVDAVTVAAPTRLHLPIGEKCLAAGKHLLMEKPLADCTAGAARLVDLADRAGVVLMVGHVERYNPAVAAMIDVLRAPAEEIVFIDTRRLAPFDGTRCLDVDVLYDLLIHDLDLVLEIANSPIRRVSATGQPVFSDRTDVVQASIEFENRVCARLWAGKCFPVKVRTITVTTRSRYIEADTLACTLTVNTAETLPAMDEGVCFMGDINVQRPPVPAVEPLRMEFDDFVGAIRQLRVPVVDGARALKDLKALDLIAEVLEKSRTGPAVEEIESWGIL
ncbi:MAG: Gfo/Idh/MocA family oxidoreductase [Desulfomonile sp.]|nr:Gfo/Idh/MocA family oxidoreductase [Desulfomonile sp.]